MFDAIEEKMPWMRNQTVFIQQDGAKPHAGDGTIRDQCIGTISGTIRDLKLAGSGDGWTMKVITQSSQSPDVNINDLGFFNSLKSRVREIQAYTTEREEMMEIVQRCFDDYPMDNLDGIYGGVCLIIIGLFWPVTEVTSIKKLTIGVERDAIIQELRSTWRPTWMTIRDAAPYAMHS